MQNSVESLGEARCVGQRENIPFPPLFCAGRDRLEGRYSTMCDNESLRYCKAYLRRRLAYGPPVVERERGESEEGAAGEPGVSAWGHLWPLGRQLQCEELRRVRKGWTRPCWMVCVRFVGQFSLFQSTIYPPTQNVKNSKFKNQFRHPAARQHTASYYICR